MSKLSILISLMVLYIINPTNTYAQVWEGNVLLETQTEVDNFSTECNCTEISGNLAISGNSPFSSPKIENLDGLSNLTSVGGYFIITNNTALTNLDGLSNITSLRRGVIIERNALTNLDGLSNLTLVGEHLLIDDNDALTNLDGLSNITSLEGDLSIKNNPALMNIDGLSNLTSVRGDLFIAANDTLINLDGLNKLTSVGGDLIIAVNNTLTDLDGLSNLVSVEGNLDIKDNPALIYLYGLSQLTSVGGFLRMEGNAALINIDGLSLTSVGKSLSIEDNAVLTNLDGLSSFTSIGGSLRIVDNAVLTNLDGLNNITSIGGSLIIWNNVELSACCLVACWDRNDVVQGSYYIGGEDTPFNSMSNGSNCSSLTEIQDACDEALLATLCMGSPNTAPVAQNDAVSTNEDEAVSIAVLANDTDNGSLSIESFTQAENGLVSQEGEELVYTPNENFNGNDAFDYTITDGELTATAIVEITINAVNDEIGSPVVQGPEDGAVLADWGSLAFSWEDVINPDNDPITYTVTIVAPDGTEIVIEVDDNTTFEFDPSEYDLEPSTSYTWNITASDGENDSTTEGGTFTTPDFYVGLEDELIGIALGQNQPNPFSESTMIPFQLSETSSIELVLYDITGQKVRTLFAGQRGAGAHRVSLDANGLSAGVYFYQLRVGKVKIARRVIMMN